jgi:hypothetical protein
VIYVVYLSNESPSRIASDLTCAGCNVWEATSVSEVLYLCEHDQVDAVVIGPDVEDQEFIERQLRQTTLKLTDKTRAADVIWELSNLFGSQSSRVQ